MSRQWRADEVMVVWVSDRVYGSTRLEMGEMTLLWLYQDSKAEWINQVWVGFKMDMTSVRA